MTTDIKELLHRAVAADQAALNTLIDLVYPVMRGTLRKFNGLSVAEQEDLHQDVFVILLTRGIQSFRGTTEHEFRWYVKTITANETKTYLHKRSRCLDVLDPFLSDTEDGETPASVTAFAADPDLGPEEQVAGQEIVQALHRCVQELAVADQEIFWMRGRELPYATISKLLKLPTGTVGVKYQRAKAKIADCLQKAGILP